MGNEPPEKGGDIIATSNKILHKKILKILRPFIKIKMINIFINRVFRAIKIDIDLYEEVEKDKSATFQAGIVVVLSSLAAGVGALQLGSFKFFTSTNSFFIKLVCLGLCYLFCRGKIIWWPKNKK